MQIPRPAPQKLIQWVSEDVDSHSRDSDAGGSRLEKVYLPSEKEMGEFSYNEVVESWVKWTERAQARGYAGAG